MATESNTGENLRAELSDHLQLRIGDISLDFEVDADALKSLAHGVVEVEKAVHVNVAFERGFDSLDVNTASGSMIDHRGRQACSECVKQVFGRVCSGVFAEKNCGLVGFENEGLRTRLLLADAVELIHGRRVLTGILPPVLDVESEFCDLGSVFDGFDGCVETIDVYSVNQRAGFLCCRHLNKPLLQNLLKQIRGMIQDSVTNGLAARWQICHCK